MSSELDTLTRININDLLTAFGLQHVPYGRHLLTWLCTPPARRFARQVLAYDHQVGKVGLHASGQWGLEAFKTTVKVYHATQLPQQGPLLLLANHPGLTDALIIFANIPRADLRVIAATRDFLQALPNINDCLVYVDLKEKSNHHLNAIRVATAHLRNGGALLTFPAGKIEPDPALHSADARAAFAHWSTSIDLFARLVPETQIVPMLISGVLNPQAQRNPLTRLRRTRKDREWLGATLQLLLPFYQAVQAEIRFGKPLLAGDLLARDNPRAATTAVIAAMQELVSSRWGS